MNEAGTTPITVNGWLFHVYDFASHINTLAEPALAQRFTQHDHLQIGATHILGTAKRPAAARLHTPLAVRYGKYTEQLQGERIPASAKPGARRSARNA